MIDRTGVKVLTAILLTLAVTTATTPAGADPIVAGVSSVAVNDDASALLVNPAGLCRSIPSGSYMSWDRTDSGPLRIGTILVAGQGAGFGYQVEQPRDATRMNRLLLGIGGGYSGPVSLGLRGKYEWQRIGHRETAWRWDLGLMYRPCKFASLGAVAHDLNQDGVFGVTYKRRYSAGLGLRPLPGDLGSRLTLYADVNGPEDGSWKSDGSLHAGFWTEILNGIAIGGAVDGPFEDFSDERTFSVGFRVDALHNSSLGTVQFDSDNEVYRYAGASHFTSSRQRTLQKEKTLTRAKIGGKYADETSQGLPIPIIGGRDASSVRPLLRELENARKDPHVRGVLIELSSVSPGALGDEIRDAIHGVRDEGKPVVAFTKELWGRSQLYIASACDRIVLDRLGDGSSMGVRAAISYYGEMLDSAGVRFEKVAIGKYKTAGDQLVNPRPSEGMRESINSILDDRDEHQLNLIASERNLTRDELDDLVSGKWFAPDELLEAGLIDSVGDERAARRILARLADMKEKSEAVSATDWTYPTYDWATGPKVAVLWLDGMIISGESRAGFFTGNTMGSETVVKQLRALAGRRDVKAVVLRIDSGGGSALGSDEIWRAVDELKKKGKKVVSSMARVAGSGGYYIACNSDRIVAEPTTITGSIGVLMIKPDLTGWYEKKRIHIATFQRGDWMGLFSGKHRWTEEEREHVMTAISRIYDGFVDLVVAERGMTWEEVDAVGRGRVWTGRQALENGLIDELGGLKEAIATARELAGLPEDAKVEHIYRPGRSWIERAILEASVKLGVNSERDAALQALGNGLLGAEHNPIASWMYRSQLRAMTGDGPVEQMRFENPLLELLAE